MEAAIQQQTSILDAALGNALPVKMPPEWEGRLEELEAVVGGRARPGESDPRPHNPGGVEARADQPHDVYLLLTIFSPDNAPIDSPPP